MVIGIFRKDEERLATTTAVHAAEGGGLGVGLHALDMLYH